MNVKDLGRWDGAENPAIAVGHHEVAPAQADAPILERPVQQAVGDQGPAGILAEQVAFVTKVAAQRVEAVDVRRIVVAALHAIRQPEAVAVTDEARDGRPRPDLGEARHDLLPDPRGDEPKPPQGRQRKSRAPLKEWGLAGFHNPDCSACQRNAQPP